MALCLARDVLDNPRAVNQHAAAAKVLARLMDNPRATNQQPAAAKVLASLLDKLAAASASGRGGRMAVVRTLTAASPTE